MQQPYDLARTFAEDNARRGYLKPDRVASADFTMQAVGMTSTKCLAQRACLPVGGFSVVASVPPTTTANDARGEGGGEGGGVILVSARLDASSLFHNLAAGANAAMSGLIVMLAAAQGYNQALQSYHQSTSAVEAKPVVFAAFAAEDWGYAGSRRFAHDVTATSKDSAVPGLAGRSVDAVVELGAVGLAGLYKLNSAYS
jgi:nicastrin